jgi:hypothetical protein
VRGGFIVVATVSTLLGVSCAATRLELPTLLDPVALQAGDDPTDANAVVLIERRRYLVHNPPRVRGTTEVQHHRAIKILTESAITVGSTHIYVPSGATLVDLRARTITPSGEVVPVDVSAVLNSTFVSDGDEGETRSFQFPRVEVGSVLEHTSTIVHEGGWWMLNDEPSGAHPIKRYEVEILVDADAKPDLYVSNAVPKLTLEPGPGGMQRIRFALDNIAMLPDVPMRRPTRELGPWWIYRTIEWRTPRALRLGVSSWARASGEFHNRIINNKDLDGFDVRHAEGCNGDVRCVVGSGLKTLREDVKLSGFTSSLAARPLAEVKASGAANNQELALALMTMLKRADVDAKLALMSRAAFTPAVESFPASTWLNHALVAVTMGDQRLWVDPSCEACGVGELPTWSHGGRAVVLYEGDSPYGGTELRNDAFQTVTGKRTMAGKTTRSVRQKLDDAGDCELDVVVTHSGEPAVDVVVQQLTDSEKERRRRHLGLATADSKTATLTSSTPWRCDRAAARCEEHYSYKVVGCATETKGGAVRLVDVQGLRSPAIARLLNDKTRAEPIFISGDLDYRESATFEVPAGFRAKKTFKARGLTAPGLHVEVEASTVDGVVTVTRAYVQQHGRHPAKAAEGLRAPLQLGSDVIHDVIRVERAPAHPEASPPAAAPEASPPQASPESIPETTPAMR